MSDFTIDELVEQRLKSVKVLCVEDNKTTQMLYASFLEDLIEEVYFSDDGESGYQKFLEYDVDMVVVDHHMPKMSGLELIQKIRTINDAIPIVFASSTDDSEVIMDTFTSGVVCFVKKPVNREEFLKSIYNSARVLLAQAKSKQQKEQEEYTKFQENLGFAKELNILRNDFYYQMIEQEKPYLIDFLYKPLDILSGDAYCARRIDRDNTFYLMVDGMGKGLSASLTAMLMTSFVNHMLDKMIQTDSFDLAVLIHETMEYIKPILLDEESLAIDYIHMDNKEELLYYAKFSMPVLLMESTSSEIIRLRSNNSALSKWQRTFNIDSYDIANIKKFLIYSDGIVENGTVFGTKTYANFIEEDFLKSFTKEDLRRSFFEKISEQEDDLSLIYINHLVNTDNNECNKKVYEASFDAVDDAGEWFENNWHKLCSNEEEFPKASVVFTELFMNAFEHGCLGINSDEKHQLLEDDIYFETIEQKSLQCDKKIELCMRLVTHCDANYIITKISDGGDGFDTQILSEIFRNSATFNGRGVFVSRKNSLGIYYNAKGNCVLFLHKV